MLRLLVERSFLLVFLPGVLWKRAGQTVGFEDEPYIFNEIFHVLLYYYVNYFIEGRIGECAGRAIRQEEGATS